MGEYSRLSPDSRDFSPPRSSQTEERALSYQDAYLPTVFMLGMQQQPPLLCIGMLVGIYVQVVDRASKRIHTHASASVSSFLFF